MPLYDLKCTNEECDFFFDDMFLHMNDPRPACPLCGEPTEVDFNKQLNENANFHDFSKYAGVWEDIETEPVEVRSRGQLRDLCKRNGLYSKLLDG